MKNQIKYIIVHHCGGIDSDPLFDTSNQSFEVVNEYHRQKWDFKSALGYYLGYQYYIDKSGKVTQARLDEEEGAHTIGYNKESIGICLAGNFDLTMPTPEQIKSLRELLLKKKKEYNILASNILPHRHFANKSCYGRNLSEDWARSLTYEITQPAQSCQAERDIIVRNDKEIASLKADKNNLLVFIRNLFRG